MNTTGSNGSKVTSQFIESLRDEVLRLGRKYGITKDDQEDILQETLLVLLTYDREEIRNPYRFSLGVIKNRCLLHGRMMRTRRKAGLISLSQVDTRTLRAASGCPELNSLLLRRLVGQLRAVEREVLYLWSQKYSVREIAEIAGGGHYSEASIGQVRLRALRKLAKLLNDQGPRGETTG